jgi:hypothetical protein
MKKVQRNIKLHQGLSDFTLFYEYNIPLLINNVRLLREKIPRDIKNPVMLFLLDRAVNSVVETLILEVKQTWEILSGELKRMGEAPLLDPDRNYKDLKDIRDKLLAHRIEASLSTNQYLEWYKEKYGTYESIFILIGKVAKKIYFKICKLQSEKKLLTNSATGHVLTKLKIEDVENLLAALKTAKIY